MNISYNWLKKYLDFDIPPAELGDILTEIGLEVEGIEEFESVKGGLEGLVIGEVTHKEKHPDADKLSVTKVNIGNGADLEIVCGAPNVAAGQKVVVATVGTTIYPIEGDPFKIKSAKIRGVESHGMICAEDEIGLGGSHDGIMVLPDDVEVGKSASDHFNIERDFVFDIGLTPNRSDATCHLGVAEDLAAALKINYGHSGLVKRPSVDNFKIDNNDLPIEVVVENTKACPRYSGVSITGIKVGPSPQWLVNRLASVGVRTTNNVVDITNFILHELGQPLHAFDANEISDQKIIVKNLPEGSLFKSLDEIDRKLKAEDLMICDGQSKPMCIGGVFGGIKSGVKDQTTSIFLESAHFEATQLRRSSTKHLLRTDAAKVFEKGSDPNNTLYALKRAAVMISELAGGKISSEIVDIYPNKISPAIVEVSYKNVNRLIGVDISKEEIHKILDALNMNFTELDEDSFRVEVPTNKADVTREADVIEEILRIYGFNRVEIPNRISSSLSFSKQPDPRKVRHHVASFLTGNGFYEMMGLSITQSKYFSDVYPLPEKELVFINNTSNQDLDIMRPVMSISALETVLHNLNYRNKNLKLFEFGNTYVATESGHEETAHLTVTLSGKRLEEGWTNSENKDVSIYSMKSFVQSILKRIGINGYQESEVQDPLFSYGLKYHRGEQVLVNFGKISAAIQQKMGLKQEVYFADFNFDRVLKALKNSKLSYKELSKFPSMRRDLALIIDKSVNFNQIASIARKEGKKILADVNLFDVYENEDKLGGRKKSCSVSFVFQDENKTLTDSEVDKVIEKIINSCERELSAEIRR